jgi:hypothetical protein
MEPHNDPWRPLRLLVNELRTEVARLEGEGGEEKPEFWKGGRLYVSQATQMSLDSARDELRAAEAVLAMTTAGGGAGAAGHGSDFRETRVRWLHARMARL